MGNCFSSTRGLKKDHISLNPQPTALQIHEPPQILPQQDPIQIHTPLIHPGPLPRPLIHPGPQLRPLPDLEAPQNKVQYR